MNRQQIELLLKNPELKGATLVETHISWLLMLPETVYKMKKDVQFSFLDFSVQAKRKYYCEHELMLNRRLAPDLYEEVVAVNSSEDGLEFGAYGIHAIDYAIRMKRIAKKWEMAGMLERGEVLPEHLDLLASQIAEFHRNTEIDESLFNPIKELDEFSDIGNYSTLLVPHIGETKMDEILAGVEVARVFLRDHHQRFHDRRVLGFTIDGHGDLHAANVFLEKGKPIIFDCIEFNDEFRKIDVLDEIAFLCVDLEAAGRDDLAERFAASYQARNNRQLTEEDEWIFDYYKCYRANIRLKITAIKIGSLLNEAHAAKLLTQLHCYFEIHLRYLDRLKTFNGGVA
jgi:hypothetical protein